MLPSIPPRSPRRQQAGFLLPLASGTALVLLLTGLSLQGAVLHQRELAAEALRQHRAQDALASAAQRLAAQLDGPYACLQPLPLEHWAAAAAACEPPISPAQLAQLRQPEEAGLPLQLLAWEPRPEAATLQWAVAPAASPGAATQRRFALRYAAAGSLQSLQEVGP